jgi:SAM-dependent methyltransferase
MGAKRYVDRVLYRLGLAPDPRWERVRRRLATEYLRGHGLEIGALNEPLQVPPEVTVDHLDCRSREENIARHPEIDANEIVEPRYIDDGFTLTAIAGGSQDFVIANHVLEHAPTPLQAPANWARVLSPGGVLFVTVPIAEHCFDRGRSLTSLDHLVEDYELYRRGELDEVRRRNHEHYREWPAVSVPNRQRERGEVPETLSAEELASWARQMTGDNAEIHFHTFSAGSFAEILTYFTCHVAHGMHVEDIAATREVTAILRKEREGATHSKRA